VAVSSIDLRRYDPRRIIRDALDAPSSTPTVGDALETTRSAPPPDAPPGTPDGAPPAPDTSAESEGTAPPATVPQHPWTDADIARIRPGQRYAVIGDSAHPRRILLASLPADDPLRLASAPPPPASAPSLAQ
jgi:sec-independent protein translocase protein TatB